MTRIRRWSTSSALALCLALGAGACTGADGTDGNNGNNGDNGENSLVSITPEPAGANCTNGGSKVEVGLDVNGNGTLDADEVDDTQTTYLCNGDSGSGGQDALIATSTEPPGQNCANGGIKIEVGLDVNGNGVLDPSEVNSAATSYTCNGTGLDSLVVTTVEPAGANCVTGGTKIESGLDLNGDGVLDSNEITQTSYVCDGAGGLTGPGGISSISAGIHASVVSVSTDPALPVTVRFTLKDDRGYPIDINGVYSLNIPIAPVFMLAYTDTDASGNVLPYIVYTKSGATPQPTSYSPRATTPVGTLVENGYAAGDYTYTFPTTTVTNGAQAVAYDPTKLGKTHVLWIEVSRQTDTLNTTAAATFSAVDQAYWYIPSGGTPVVREIVKTENCNNCHRNFKPEGLTSNAFHTGRRVDAKVCGICHNPARTNAAAEANTFIHRLHNSEELQPANLFHGIEFAFPRDIRNCNTCHGGAAQGAQAQIPTRKACTSCHDYTSFTSAAANTCTDPVTVDAAGIPVPCNHYAGPYDNDAACTLGCHSASALGTQHKQVAPPDTNNSWRTATITAATEVGTTATFTTAGAHGFTADKLVTVSGEAVTGYNGTWLITSVPAPTTFVATLTTSGLAAGGAGVATGGNGNTNAAFIAATGYVPTGAAVITYDVKSVDLVDDTAIAPNKRLQITFKLKKDNVDVAFQTFGGAVTEMMPNFYGSPSVYFAFAVPQDGITAPADFNASASGYIKAIWNNTATSTGTGLMTGPDGSGYYTIKLTGVQVPPTATMVTGGVGYTYGLASTAPLTQTGVTGFAYSATTKQGGIIVPAPDVWKVATGFTGRRPIVDNAKCLNCHAPLGVEPTFHSGQRNDGPSCSFCHNPNRTSSGWSAGSRSFIHGIHGARKRDVAFNWHASSPNGGFWDIEFPGPLNDCTACHAANTYNFRAATTTAVMDKMLVSTVGANSSATVTTYNNDPVTNPNGYFSVSPYVAADNVTTYGAGFAFAGATGAITPAASTTLVITPITNACSGCHDSAPAVGHMRAMGGHFYDTRANTLSANAPVEQCLLCHGPGTMADVETMH